MKTIIVLLTLLSFSGSAYSQGKDNISVDEYALVYLDYDYATFVVDYGSGKSNDDLKVIFQMNDDVWHDFNSNVPLYTFKVLNYMRDRGYNLVSNSVYNKGAAYEKYCQWIFRKAK